MTEPQGKVAIVTGASAGIGEAIARRLAIDGMKVVLAARRAERLQAIQREIERRGGSAAAIPADITRPGDQRRLVEECLRLFGRIDVLVNNAGFGYRCPLELTPMEAIRANFDTNLFGLIALTQQVIPVMRAARQGWIVNLSSVAGRIARPLSSVYDASKHALEAISDGMRQELAPLGIRVIVIQPGFVTTEFPETALRLSAPLYEGNTEYRAIIEKAQRRDRQLHRFAASPERIADLVSEALRSRHPRARYAAPFFARVALGFKKVLPERLFQKFME